MDVAPCRQNASVTLLGAFVSVTLCAVETSLSAEVLLDWVETRLFFWWTWEFEIVECSPRPAEVQRWVESTLCIR